MKKFRNIAISVVAGIVLLFIGSLIGNSLTTATLNGQKATAEDLLKEIDKLHGIKNQAIEDNKSLFNTIDKKNEIVNEYNGDLDDLEQIKGELKDTKAQLANKEIELSTLTGQVTEAKGAPKTLGAGQYVVGKDIPAGRYTVTNVGRGSNFFVYDASGSAVVNTILGNDSSIGDGDYTFFTEDGNIIETHARVKLIPVE